MTLAVTFSHGYRKKEVLGSLNPPSTLGDLWEKVKWPLDKPQFIDAKTFRPLTLRCQIKTQHVFVNDIVLPIKVLMGDAYWLEKTIVVPVASTYKWKDIIDRYLITREEPLFSSEKKLVGPCDDDGENVKIEDMADFTVALLPTQTKNSGHSSDVLAVDQTFVLPHGESFKFMCYGQITETDAKRLALFRMEKFTLGELTVSDLSFTIEDHQYKFSLPKSWKVLQIQFPAPPDVHLKPLKLVTNTKPGDKTQNAKLCAMIKEFLIEQRLCEATPKAVVMSKGSNDRTVLVNLKPLPNNEGWSCEFPEHTKVRFQYASGYTYMLVRKQKLTPDKEPNEVLRAAFYAQCADDKLSVDVKISKFEQEFIDVHVSEQLYKHIWFKNDLQLQELTPPARREDPWDEIKKRISAKCGPNVEFVDDFEPKTLARDIPCSESSPIRLIRETRPRVTVKCFTGLSGEPEVRRVPLEWTIADLKRDFTAPGGSAPIVRLRYGPVIPDDTTMQQIKDVLSRDVELVIRAQGAEFIPVTLVMENQKDYQFSPNDTILQVRRHVANDQKCDFESVYVLYAGKSLPDELVLSSVKCAGQLRLVVVVLSEDPLCLRSQRAVGVHWQFEDKSGRISISALKTVAELKVRLRKSLDLEQDVPLRCWMDLDELNDEVPIGDLGLRDGNVIDVTRVFASSDDAVLKVLNDARLIDFWRAQAYKDRVELDRLVRLYLNVGSNWARFEKQAQRKWGGMD